LIDELFEVCTLHSGFVGEAEGKQAIGERFSAEGGEQEQVGGCLGFGYGGQRSGD